MISIQSNEMKTHLSGVLRRVEEGQEFLISKHKKIVAKLIPFSSDLVGNTNPKEAVEAVKQLKSLHISQDEIQEFRQTGRK